MEATYMSIDRGMDREDVGYTTYKGILLGHKKVPFVATWMVLEIIILILSKEEKDKYHMLSLICGI